MVLTVFVVTQAVKPERASERTIQMTNGTPERQLHIRQEKCLRNAIYTITGFSNFSGLAFKRPTTTSPERCKLKLTFSAGTLLLLLANQNKFQPHDRSPVWNFLLLLTRCFLSNSDKLTESPIDSIKLTYMAGNRIMTAHTHNRLASSSTIT